MGLCPHLRWMKCTLGESQISMRSEDKYTNKAGRKQSEGVLTNVPGIHSARKGRKRVQLSKTEWQWHCGVMIKPAEHCEFPSGRRISWVHRLSPQKPQHKSLCLLPAQQSCQFTRSWHPKETQWLCDGKNSIKYSQLLRILTQRVWKFAEDVTTSL